VSSARTSHSKESSPQVRAPSQHERIVEVVRDLTPQRGDVLRAGFEEAVDTEAVIALRHLATKARHEAGRLRRIKLALEDGLLDALSVRFAHLRDTSKPLPSLCGVCRHVIGNEELHGISPQW